eukprot:245477_1
MTESLWSSTHTIFGIILLICLVSVFKNAFVYYEDYADALGLTKLGYSVIMLSCYLGNITSLFFGIFINKLFSNRYHLTASLSALLSGILSLLYGFTASISATSSATGVFYGSMIAFLYKNSASICYTTVVGLANEYSTSEHKGANISYLQLSWSISTLLYIPVGYMIQYVSWFLPFCVFGILLIIYCFILHFGFTFDMDSEMIATQSELSTSSVTVNISDLKRVFNRKIVLILISIFFCGIASGSVLITTTSFWMEDVYGLTSSQVGWYTLCIFVAEMTGSLIMSQISDKYGIFVCSFVAFAIKIIDSLIIFNLSLILGDAVGGLWVAVILNFFLFVGWEMFFITQILAMIEFGPPDVSKNIILLSNFAIASIAKAIGTELSAGLWKNGEGLKWLACIWLVCTIGGAISYWILYQIKDVRADWYTPIPDHTRRIDNADLDEPMISTAMDDADAGDTNVAI